MKTASAAILVAIILLPAFGSIAVPTEAQEFNKQPVGELFVYIGCRFCKYAEDAMPTVVSATGALILEYHIWSDNAGWKLPEGDALASIYGVTGTPALILDGVQKFGGADPSGYGDPTRFTESCRDAYISGINDRPKQTNFGLSVDLRRGGNNFTATATVIPGESASGIFALRFVAFETTATFEDTTYRNVVRAVLSPIPVTLGNASTITETFPVPTLADDVSRIRIAALLYNTETWEIYQSAYSGPPLGGSMGATGFKLSTTEMVLIGAAATLAVAVTIRWKKK